MMKFIGVIFFALCLLGCRTEISPLVAGSVIDGGLFLGKYTINPLDKPPKSWSLSKNQLEKMDAWIRLHQQDWQMALASPPPPSYSILLTHKDGSRSQINLYSLNENWQHAIHISVFDRDGNFISGGEMSIASAEISSLMQLLSEVG